MSETTQVAPATCPNRSVLIATIDALVVGSSVCRYMETMFRAVIDASDEYSKPHDLAEVGKYLACDQADTLQGERERLEELQRKLEVRS